MNPISSATLVSLTIADPAGRAAYEQGKSSWVSGPDAAAWLRFCDRLADASSREPLPPGRQLAASSSVPVLPRRLVEVGDLIWYRSMFFGQCNAVVIHVRRHVLGDPTIVAYDFANQIVSQLPIIGGDFRIIGRGNVFAAREHYRAHLATYPVWAERFAAQPTYDVFALHAA